MIIRAKSDLYNGGKCFTKGGEYEIINMHQTHTPRVEAGLIDKYVINDLGEKHCIGCWWREFKIIKS